jgi:hypothetical protein
MTYSAFLLAMRNSAQAGGKQVRQNVNRAAKQTQRPVQNQTQRSASTQSAEATKKQWSFKDEDTYDFLTFDVSMGRL